MSSWGLSWGDSWGLSWGLTESGVYIDLDLLEALSGLYNPEYQAGAIKYLDLLESNSNLPLVYVDQETAILPPTLISEMILKAYNEISLGSGNIITLGFVDGDQVLIFPKETPWGPETEVYTGGDVEVGIEYDTTVLDSETVLETPVLETGPIPATLQIGSTQYSIAVYGDAIYMTAVGSGTTPMYPTIDARRSSEPVPDLIEANSTILTPSPYAWHRIDTSTLLVQSTVNPSTVDTDCAIMLPSLVETESYVFMCRIIRDGAPDTPPIYD